MCCTFVTIQLSRRAHLNEVHWIKFHLIDFSLLTRFILFKIKSHVIIKCLLFGGLMVWMTGMLTHFEMISVNKAINERWYIDHPVDICFRYRMQTISSLICHLFCEILSANKPFQVLLVAAVTSPYFTVDEFFDTACPKKQKVMTSAGAAAAADTFQTGISQSNWCITLITLIDRRSPLAIVMR